MTAAAEERQVLSVAAQRGTELGNRDLEHLANAAGIRNYQRMADNVARHAQRGRILDWGCGYGQMTYLLRNRGLHVLPFDVGPRASIEAIQPFCGLGIEYGTHAWQLPFDDASFDAVLSCGVLEHVPDPDRSCQEIARVLRPNGSFLITMLPNRYSFIERVNTLLGISDHPVKYNVGTAASLLTTAGFDIIASQHANMLPKNLIGLPKRFKTLYGHASPAIIGLDTILSQMPLLNSISGTIEIIGRRRATNEAPNLSGR